ncbi:peptidase S8/S53 domain-containing protein [Syncephalis fuscata]|nr:peptidase S8/S53 domain-containing protein [Syncephalis fuscata]
MSYTLLLMLVINSMNHAAASLQPSSTLPEHTLVSRANQAAPEKSNTTSANDTSPDMTSYLLILAANPGTKEARDQQDGLVTFLQKNLKAHVRQKFDTLLNGISIDVEDTFAIFHGLQSLPTIKNVERIVGSSLMAPRPDFIGDYSTLNAPQENDAGLSSNIDRDGGNGIKIGIIDSGIDYHHIALGGCFGEGCKIGYGYDFVGDNFNGLNTPMPDNDPMDECNGHGTHVAGIIGAVSEIKVGIAPRATLGAYRVMGCGNATVNDIVIKGMERAYADHMDIVNLSLATLKYYTDTAISQAAQQLVSLGVVVVAAAGNDGNIGLFSLASPGTAPGVITVAAADPQNPGLFTFMVNITDRPVRYMTTTKSVMPALGTAQEVAMVEKESWDKCQTLKKQYKNQFILMKRGACDFITMGRNAQQAGASGVIVLNTTPQVEIPNLDSSIKIPVLMVVKEDGPIIEAEMKAAGDKPTFYIRWEQRGRKEVKSNNWLWSKFSSCGPSPILPIVYSIYPRKLGNYAVYTGTSMAAPFVSGLAAVALQRMGTSVKLADRPAEVRRMLVQTADLLPMTQKIGSTNETFISPVIMTGVGVVRGSATREPNWGISPSSIAFVGAQAGTTDAVRKFDISLIGPMPAGTVTFRHRPAVGRLVEPVQVQSNTSPLLDVGTFLAKPSSVTIESAGGGKTTTQKISITIGATAPSPNSQVWILSGVIEAVHKDSAGKITIRRIPYQTTLGSVQSLKPIRVSSKFPLVKSTGNFSQPTVTPSPFSLVNLSYQLDYPTTNVFAIVEDASTGKQLGIAEGVGGHHEYSTMVNSDYFLSSWAGLIRPMTSFGVSGPTPSPLPDGSYRLKLFALRMFSNISSEKSYDSWTSPSINVVGVAAAAAASVNRAQPNSTDNTTTSLSSSDSATPTPTK